MDGEVNPKMYTGRHPYNRTTPPTTMGPYWADHTGKFVTPTWGFLDGVVISTFAGMDQPFYRREGYAPFGLPFEVAGAAYTHRFRLLILAIEEVCIRLMSDHPLENGPVDLTGESTVESALSYMLYAALYSNQVIQLRGQALHIPHSFIDWKADETSVYGGQWRTTYSSTEEDPNVHQDVDAARRAAHAREQELGGPSE